MSRVGYSTDGMPSTKSRDGVILASCSVIALGTLLALFIIYGSPGEFTAHLELAAVSP